MISHATLQTDFPPSFNGNPWSYGFALFSLTLICAFASAMLLHFIFEARAKRAALELFDMDPVNPVPWSSPLTIHRMIVTGFLLTVLFGAFPDVLVMFWWGEASDSTMNMLFLIDRIGDGLTFAPFSMAVAMSAWGSQVLPQQLIRVPARVRRPTLRTISDELKIAGLVLIIAIGVTLAKANIGA